jgi:hypothetical protein
MKKKPVNEKFSEFEKETLQYVDRAIKSKYPSIRAFAHKNAISTSTLNETFRLRQHMNLKLLGKILAGLDNDIGAVFTGESLVARSGILDELTAMIAQKIGDAEMANVIMEMLQSMLNSLELRTELVGYYIHNRAKYKKVIATKRVSANLENAPLFQRLRSKGNAN